MRKIWLSLIALAHLTFASAQDSEQKPNADRGQVSGYFRSYLMGTDNAADLKDYFAFANGGFLKYQSPSYKGFRVDIGGYVSINSLGNDLSERDSSTGRLSRYELGLFNNLDPSQQEVAILGEANLSYQYSSGILRLGRFTIKTPFMNPQDGRMIPTIQQGLWWKQSLGSHHLVEVYGINAIAPRSTDAFFDIGRSIGTYPMGRNVDISPGDYGEGKTESDFVLIGHYRTQYQGLKLDLWNYHVDNVFNLSYAQLGWDKALPSHHKVSLAGQYLYQNRVGQGGKADPSLRYYQQESAQVWGLKAAHQYRSNSFSIAYNRVADAGRFLFPREWGRESLFTFQKRERTEGQADAHNLLLEFAKQHDFGKQGQLRYKLGYGFYQWQDVKDAAKNKYGIPAHDQLNIDVFYNFTGKWKGLQLEFLMAWKPNRGEDYDNPKFIHNKVDMAVYQLILNYRF